MILRFHYLSLFFFLLLFYLTFNLETGFPSRTVFANSGGVTLTVSIASCGNGTVDIGEQCDGSNFGGGNCAALGFNGGTLGCSASCQHQTNSCIATAFTASTTQTMSFSSGGNFTFVGSNANVLFSFPANFYTEDLKLQSHSYLASFFASEKPVVSGKSFIGTPYDFSFVIPSGSSMNSQIFTLSAPITITMNYTDSDVSGFTESTLAPYRWGASDSSWQLISGATVDTANNKVTFSTASFSSFTIFGVAEPPAPAPAPSGGDGGGGGGGGGGGYFAAPETKIIFSGRAYPGMKVTVLKDAQIAASVLADSNAAFNISLAGLSTGNYIFSIYSEDKDGRRSSLITYPVSVTSGATVQIGGIFIAPTIAVDKSEVRRGDNITVFGQTASQSEVTVMINSDEEYFAKVKADKDGIYLYNFDSSPLDYGDHNAKSKSALSGSLSSFSAAVPFKVGARNVLAPKFVPQKVLKGNVNGDNKVNLIDFSIVAYWYKRPSPPAKVDLNGDGKVDLVDFSIMAYHWTG